MVVSLGVAMEIGVVEEVIILGTGLIEVVVERSKAIGAGGGGMSCSLGFFFKNCLEASTTTLFNLQKIVLGSRVSS